MPVLKTQHDLARIDPGPCYLCGGPLDDGRAKNKQHVVPKRLFAPEDRTPLLILPAHNACNDQESDQDELVGQLTGLLWRSSEDAARHVHRIRKMIQPAVDTVGGQAGVMEDFPLSRIVARWVQGFHAALYEEHVPFPRRFNLSGPFPGGDDPATPGPIPGWHQLFVGTLKRNRAAGRLDVVELAGGKCRYWCTWSDIKDSASGVRVPTCIFAIDLYDWSRLGGTFGFPQMSCVGCYSPKTKPVGATDEITVDTLFSNTSPYNAFGT